MAFGYEYWMVHLSEFDPLSFLLFVHNPRGQTKLRSYFGGSVRVLGQPSLQEVVCVTVRDRTRFQVDPHDTTDTYYWNKVTADFNARYLSSSGIGNAPAPPDEMPAPLRKQSCKHGRSDASGRARHGSQRQLQDYVNEYEDVLSNAIVEAIPALRAKLGSSVTWVSPLARDGYTEYRDRDFLHAVELGEFGSQLAQFWPSGGPVWDALATTSDSAPGAIPGIVLVEAKSHISEIYGSGCQASPRSRSHIEASFAAVRNWCGGDRDANWTGPLYQSANRFAHLYFLREVLRRPAWLVNLYFVNDPIGPADRDTWAAELRKVKAALGLRSPAPFTVDVFLPALNCSAGRKAFVDVDGNEENDSIPHSSTPGPAVRPRYGTGTSVSVLAASSASNPVVSWANRWMAHASYSGPAVPEVADRIEQLVKQWREPIPGAWQRDVDSRLLERRYQRGDAAAPHPGEHTIEHEILCRHFDSVSCYGGKLVDGVNALPLIHSEMGGRHGDVEADLFLLAQSVSGYRIFLCEVKSASNNAWYAAVESLRQLKLLLTSAGPRCLFARRNPSLPLPAELPVTTLVLAPPQFYSSNGQRANAAQPALRLLSRFQSEFGVDARLAVWDSRRFEIRDWAAPNH